MVSWPERGTRVSVRYRRPAGSVPPLTDVIGRLLETTPLVRVQTKEGDIVGLDSDDVVALRVLSDKPVRASEIRALEHADAQACPDVEHEWLDGWLLRAGGDGSLRANSAVPLAMSATQSAIPQIVHWYRRRDLTPRLAVPHRLLRLPEQGEQANRVMVREVPADAAADVEAAPGQAWIADAPDGTRWVGLPPGHPFDDGPLAWGASRGATRAYVRLPEDDRTTADLARSLGFGLHHHARYITLT